jgi:hypothetical protein
MVTEQETHVNHDFNYSHIGDGGGIDMLVSWDLAAEFRVELINRSRVYFSPCMENTN